MTVPKLRMLLADDHEIIREGIAAVCRSRPDISVIGQCSGGEQTLARILSDQPDFAVIDVNMRGMGGLDLIQTVRGAQCPTRIIVLSTERDNEVVQKLLASGADGYLLKEEPARRLFDAIDSIREGHSYVTPVLRPSTAPTSALSGKAHGEGEMRRDAAAGDAEGLPATARPSAPVTEDSSDVLSALSKREWEVFRLLVDGMRPKDIASSLDISPKTVDTYRANIMRKLNVKGIAALVRLALRRNPGSASLPC